MPINKRKIWTQRKLFLKQNRRNEKIRLANKRKAKTKGQPIYLKPPFGEPFIVGYKQVGK